MIPRPVIYVVSVMLLIGAFSMPYGYYTLLRIIAFAAFCILAYDVATRGNKTLPWIFGFVAVVFNPIIKVHFPKEIWAIVDVVSAVLLIITIESTNPTSKSRE